MWKGEITPVIAVSGGRVSSRSIRLDAQRGSWNGLRLTYGKNMAGCNRTVLEQDVYTTLYGFGFIPTDYADTVRDLEALHGDVTWRRLDERSLRGLADKRVVGLVGLLIRGDYWQHGYLINHSVASEGLLYHLEELARRWA